MPKSTLEVYLVYFCTVWVYILIRVHHIYCHVVEGTHTFTTLVFRKHLKKQDCVRGPFLSVGRYVGHAPNISALEGTDVEMLACRPLPHVLSKE